MALFDYALLDLSASRLNLSARFWVQSRLQFELLLCVTGWYSSFPASGNTVKCLIILPVDGQNILPYTPFRVEYVEFHL